MTPLDEKGYAATPIFPIFPLVISFLNTPIALSDVILRKSLADKTFLPMFFPLTKLDLKKLRTTIVRFSNKSFLSLSLSKTIQIYLVMLTFRKIQSPSFI